jgi:DNA-binding response OmpR family regulator
MARILLVDDDESLRRALCRALEHEGYAIVEAGDGRQALEKLEEGPLDLVITDMIMPDSEGLELIFALRKTRPGIPVIAMSGGGHWTPEFHLALARRVGVVHVFAKPFAIEDLLGKVREIAPRAK